MQEDRKDKDAEIQRIGVGLRDQKKLVADVYDKMGDIIKSITSAYFELVEQTQDVYSTELEYLDDLMHMMLIERKHGKMPTTEELAKLKKNNKDNKDNKD
ncbi:hypothetical protein KI387_036090 [Taxus chinensis]|uniref:Uncharacterized protein n=1 Tax=Taxus chinensis TaxID=29808 RepID=A0AA38KRW6_TAXCH|nr:hypothetical protein KI387_036090 [Taxus chinensis]